MLIRCVPSQQNNPAKIYELLSWPTRTPFETIVMKQESSGASADLRSVQMAATAYFKSVGQSLYTMCRKRGVARNVMKALTLGIRRVALSCATADMGNVTSMGATERMCVDICIKQTCYATLKFCERLEQHKASTLLTATMKIVDAVSEITTCMYTCTLPQHMHRLS
jgi:hypothetical protein